MRSPLPGSQGGKLLKKVSCTIGSDLRFSVAMLLCNKFPLPFDALIEFLLCYKLFEYQEVLQNI